MIKDSTNPKIRHIGEAIADKERRLTKYIKFDLLAVPERKLICLICNRFILLPIKDQFIPHRVWTTDKTTGHARQKMVRTNKEAAKFFTETHWESCIMNYKEGVI